jgi:hypothetical protein
MPTLNPMSLATQDDLDQYLSAPVRVVSVDSSGPSVAGILGGVPRGCSIELRRPAAGEDLVEWRTLVSDLEPHVLVVGCDAGLLEAADYAHMSRRSPLLRSGDVAVDYQWMMVGSQITLVLTTSVDDGLASLAPADLHKVGALANGLVASH